MTPRKCRECGHAMGAQRKDYHYKECGLPNVVLEEIMVFTCSNCGAEEPEIPSSASLHRAIMLDLLRKNTVLCGEEIRFLRKMARMTAADLARLVGVDSTTFSKWETNSRKIGAASDRVLRLVCYTGMLERIVKTKKDESQLVNVAQVAHERESLDIREILTKIEDRKKGPKKVTINPAHLEVFGSHLVEEPTKVSVH